jgi:type III pantothenate kinase
MIVAVDVGNTRIKYGVFVDDIAGSDVFGKKGIYFSEVIPKGGRVNKKELYRSLWWSFLTSKNHPEPAAWRIAQTGSFHWQEIKTAILKVRPNDQFDTITCKNIPLKLDVDSPEKVGIDRLLAAFAAVKHYGDSPMLIIDAGTAITIDVVQNQTFCGGAILPGLLPLSETYPRISAMLSLVPVSEFIACEPVDPTPNNHNVASNSPCLFTKEPIYPGKNTESAIQNGFYWGTIGAIRQFYEMSFPQKKGVRIILTGGDADCLLSGLSRFIPPRRIKHHDTLVLDGIRRCGE